MLDLLTLTTLWCSISEFSLSYFFWNCCCYRKFRTTCRQTLIRAEIWLDVSTLSNVLFQQLRITAYLSLMPWGRSACLGPCWTFIINSSFKRRRICFPILMFASFISMFKNITHRLVLLCNYHYRSLFYWSALRDCVFRDNNRVHTPDRKCWQRNINRLKERSECENCKPISRIKACWCWILLKLHLKLNRLYRRGMCFNYL